MPGRARLYVGGCSGEPLALADCLRAAPELAAGLTFAGVWIPGVNRTDWTFLHDEARAETIFLSPELRPSFEAGRTRFAPLSYTQAWRWLAEGAFDGAAVQVSPPDADGMVSLGVSADFAPAVLQSASVKALALINPSMPAPHIAPRFPLDRFAWRAEAPAPLVSTAPIALPEAFAHIARHVAEMIDDGDTLQFGLGNVQQAVLEALPSHRRLRIHSGMVSDPLLGLLAAGAIEDAPGSVTTGVAIGSQALYQRAAGDRRFAFHPVAYTHAQATLAAIARLKAVNSVIEVDLFGQANAEFIGGRQVSGAGGLVEFLRGAALSPGGVGIAALASTAAKGTVSRITPRLPADATSVARADMQVVVTEHGAADLRGLDIDARAERLIAIAAPPFRNDLAEEWTRMRRAM